ncbi:MAG: DUF1489 domain-containing protein [Hyphomonadaceae bacterium]|nr:DUF1489 domain-containing protein [Hyphomonadaceae bacterium]
MTLHIMKLCVGADSVEDLADWQRRQVQTLKRRAPVCGTRMWPKRADEVLAGGSLYWVIKGAIVVRQRIVAIDEVRDEHGLRCGLWLDPALKRTAPQPRRAFQGWRYLKPEDAPADLSKRKGADALPPELQAQLVALGAW